jgi:hypothetical protein
MPFDKFIKIESKYLRLVFSSPENESFFFGYYNYLQINRSETKVLAQKSYFENRMPNEKDKVEIGFFDLTKKNNPWVKVSETRAFNWQQGSMLQWLGPDFDDTIIFNDCVDNRFVSRRIDLKTGKERKYDFPIYAIDRNGKFSITLNFERCYWTRAYSYATVVNKFWDTPVPQEDGVFKLDLETGELIRILSIEPFAKTDNLDKPEISHWFEHIMLNPTGNRFCFYHRFGDQNNFETNAYTVGVNGEELWKHPKEIGDFLTHFGWINEKEYLIYTVPQKKLLTFWVKADKKSSSKLKSFMVKFYRALLKPFIPSNIRKSITNLSQYYVVGEDKFGITGKLDFVGMQQDGHPSFTLNGSILLSDTYQDKENYRHLYLFGMESKKILHLGRIFSSVNDFGWRADLHPRLSLNDNFLSVDCNMNGKHQILVFELQWDEILNQIR